MIPIELWPTVRKPGGRTCPVGYVVDLPWVVTEIQFYGIGRPSSNSGAEEIGIFGPHGCSQGKRKCHDVPVVGVSLTDAQQRMVFEVCVKIFHYDIDHRKEGVQQM